MRLDQPCGAEEGRLRWRVLGGALCPRAPEPSNPVCSPGRNNGRHQPTAPPDPPSYVGALAEGRGRGAAAVPDSGILVPEAVVGGLSAVVAAVVVVVAAVVVATVVGATLGMVGTVVASVVAAGAVASVLLTAPVVPTVVGGHVGGAGGEM